MASKVLSPEKKEKIRLRREKEIKKYRTNIRKCSVLCFCILL